MIETPAAVAAVDAIAAGSDFLSVGTNDLTASTLGEDRFAANGARTHDPAVLRSIAAVVRAGRERGLAVEVCGEAASDPLVLPLLVGLGVDEVSVGAARVGEVRRWIRDLDARDAARVASAALRCDTAGRGGGGGGGGQVEQLVGSHFRNDLAASPPYDGGCLVAKLATGRARSASSAAVASSPSARSRIRRPAPRAEREYRQQALGVGFAVAGADGHPGREPHRGANELGGRARAGRFGPAGHLRSPSVGLRACGHRAVPRLPARPRRHRQVGGRDHRGRHGTLHQRRIGQPHMTVALSARARGGSVRIGAAQIAEHNDPVALVRTPDGIAHEPVVGPERAPRARPLATSIRTSGPATCPASSATPRASSALCETTTMPTTASLRRGSGRCAPLYTIEGDSTMSNDTRSSTRRATIQSVDRAARILKVLASGPRRLGVSEIADRLGLTRPTVHGLLQTLQAHGFVEQDRDSDKYQLGAGLLQLGNSYLDLNELRSRSLVHADRLATRADAAVRVGVMHADSVVIVHRCSRPDTTLQILEVGAELPLHESAIGKAMLAFLSEDALADLLSEPLPRLTRCTLGPGALRDELAEVRELALTRASATR